MVNRACPLYFVTGPISAASPETTTTPWPRARAPTAVAHTDAELHPVLQDIVCDY